MLTVSSSKSLESDAEPHKHKVVNTLVKASVFTTFCRYITFSVFSAEREETESADNAFTRRQGTDRLLAEYCQAFS